MRNAHIERIKSLRADFDAARTVLNFVDADWAALQEKPFVRGLSLSQVRSTSRKLETTYLLTLFAEFEGILRSYLASARPGKRLGRTPAEVLINSVALRLHIADNDRDSAHEVRRYRNSLVHPDGEAVQVIGFTQAVSYLNRFLAWLPPTS